MRDKCEMEEIWYLVKMDHDIDGKIDHFHPELKKNINDKVKELTEMGILNAQRPSGFESPKIIMFSGRHNKYAAFAIFVTKNEFFVYKYKKIKEVLDEIDKGEQ
jgi:hypothetical protein